MFSPEEKESIEEFKRRVEESARMRNSEMQFLNRLNTSPLNNYEQTNSDMNSQSKFSERITSSKKRKEKAIPDSYIWKEMENALIEREEYSSKLDYYLAKEERLYKDDDDYNDEYYTRDYSNAKSKQRLIIPKLEMYDCRSSENEKEKQVTTKNQSINKFVKTQKSPQKKSKSKSPCSKHCTCSLQSNKHLAKSIPKKEALKLIQKKAKEDPKKFIDRVLIHAHSCNQFMEDLKKYAIK